MGAFQLLGWLAVIVGAFGVGVWVGYLAKSAQEPFDVLRGME